MDSCVRGAFNSLRPCDTWPDPYEVITYQVQPIEEFLHRQVSPCLGLIRGATLTPRLVHAVMVIPHTRVLLSTRHPIFIDVITLIHSNHARLRTCQYLSTLIQYCFFEVTLLHSSYERNEPKETLYRTATDSTLHWVGLPKSGGCEFF